MFKKIAVLVCALCVLSISFSSVKVDLYTVTVPVISHSDQSRQTAMQEALRSVLIKISGSSSINNNQVIGQNLKNATKYATEYSYQENDESALLLTVHFDHTALDQLLSQAGLSTWGGDRPQVIAWIVDNDQILSADSDSELVEQIKQNAQDQGLPLQLPTLDLQDVNAVSVGAILRRQSQVIEQASERYHADVILLGKVDNNESQWYLIVSDQHYQWSIDANNSSLLAHKLISKVTDILSSQFEVGSNATEDLVLTIHNVETISSYAHVMNYLQAINSVNQVITLNASKDTVQFEVQLNGSAQAFVNRLQLDKQLLLEGAGNSTEDGDFIFQWIGAN